MKFVNLNDVLKFRVFYAIIDLSVIIRVGEEQSNSTEEQIDSTSIDNFYSWKPSHLLTKSENDSNSKKDQQETSITSPAMILRK